jgi:transcription elongation regulator 1
LAEIEEVLSNDKRYLDLESFKEERDEIIMDYLEEVARRGPPPPPTATEPTRRGGK